jgi:hypothetical protein
MMDDFCSQPIKKQRVFIRDRVPAEVVTAVIDANRHTPKDQLTPASIEIFFNWTDYGQASLADLASAVGLTEHLLASGKAATKFRKRWEFDI